MASDRDDCCTLWIQKAESASYLGHRDMARALTRALRRARVPLLLTQGFHPRPRMVLPEPLPVGVASEAEGYVVFFATPGVELGGLPERLNDALPDGLRVVGVQLGSHREALDVPLWLTLTSRHAEELAQQLADLELDELRLAELNASAATDHVDVRLVPRKGERASVGRLLRALWARSDSPDWIQSALRRFDPVSRDDENSPHEQNCNRTSPP